MARLLHWSGLALDNRLILGSYLPIRSASPECADGDAGKHRLPFWREDALRYGIFPASPAHSDFNLTQATGLLESAEAG